MSRFFLISWVHYRAKHVTGEVLNIVDYGFQRHLKDREPQFLLNFSWIYD